MRVKGKRVVLAAVLCMVLAVSASCGKDHTDTQEENAGTSGTEVSGTESGSTEEQKESAIELPCELENGKLLVQSLFQSSVENPDAGNEIGEDIGSLEILNQSEEYCISAEIKVTVEDGTEIVFTATDIPAGKTAWVFAPDNQSISQDSVCQKIEGTAQFGQTSLMEDQVMYSVEDTTITLQNLTENDLTDLSVYCHCLFEDVYFGGRTYCYPVELLPAGGTAVVEAADCFMGTAEVVAIRKNS